MKIKSLLLGSAAVFAVASAAQAADAITVEPEPVEYVRICDAYGSGYFYIPGTETCLKIGGYVRTTYSHQKTKYHKNNAVYDPGSSLNAADITYLKGLAAQPADGTTVASGSWNVGKKDVNNSDWNYRGRLNIYAKNETEYGTLTSELRLQGGDNNGASGDASVGVDRAIISIAGFRGGYGDTYWTTNHDYGAGNPAINDGFYSFDQGVFADYTYTFSGFAVTGGVQQSLKGNSGGNWYNAANDTLDWYAGVNWATDWATIAFTALNDNNAVNFKTGKSKNDTAYKVSAVVPFGDTSWKVGGWYAWESNGEGRYIGLDLGDSIASAALDKEWGVWLGGKLLDNLDIYGLYTEMQGKKKNVVVAQTFGTKASGNKAKQWTIGTNWQPVSGLNVQLEYTDTKVKADWGVGAQYDQKDEQFQVRVVRSW